MSQSRYSCVVSLALAGLLAAACAGNAERTEPTPQQAAGTPAGSPQAVNVRRIEYPDADTWPALQQYISARHERLEAFAQRHPDAELHAGVTLARALSRAETEALLVEFGIALQYAEYRGARAQGGRAAFTEGALATIEADPPYNDGTFGVTYVSAEASAGDWASLADDARIALVYADHSIDRFDGVVPTEVLFTQPPSIFDLYQQLKPR